MLSVWLDTQKNRLMDVGWLMGTAYGITVILAQEVGLYFKRKLDKVL